MASLERRAKSAAGLARWLLPALALVIAAAVHRRALGAFFSTDDFVRLEEAAGLLPQARTLWRLVSEVLYVKLMLGLFGPRPLPFHIVSVALHLVNVAFVHRTGRKAGLSAAGSFFAATTFGAFPLFYTVLPSAVNINDILALTFVFLALLAFEAPTLGRAAAGVGCFVVALLCKEAVVFVPFAAVLLSRSGERLVGTARRLAPLLVVGAAFAGFYLVFREHGLGTGGEAYAVGFGVNLAHNLMTYALWSVDLVRVVPDGGLLDVNAWRIGMWPLLAFALAAALSRSRRGVILFGCAWWLVGLLPVLPLLAHSYGHYLYLPMAGFALAGAGTLDALASGLAWLLSRGRREPDRAPVERARPSARAGAVRPASGGRRQAVVAAAFVTLAVAFAARSESLIRSRASTRLGTSQFALDPFTRKMEIARRSVSSVAGQIDRSHDSLVVFNPPGLGKAISASTGKVVGPPPPGVPQYDVVGAVLGGGLALRLFEPRLDSVVFVSRWTPEYRNFTLFLEGPGGEMAKMGRGPHAHARFSSALLDAGYLVPARDYLTALVQAFPRDRMLRLLFAAALVQTGDPDDGREQARLVLEGAPPDTISAMARGLLSRIAPTK
jgi:hypothetical protein